jgi:hypothetical protein
MTFSEFKSLTAACATLQVTPVIEQFVAPLAMTASGGLRSQLDLVTALDYGQSELAVAEGLIFPILLEVWSYYRTTLRVWREPELTADDLTGAPDYAVQRTAVPGLLFCAPPYATIVEAKQEKFNEGWGQCLAAMVAAQRLNAQPDLAVYGIVTTGVVWEFGRLLGRVFLRDTQTFTLSDLDKLCGAVRYVFEQVSTYPAPPGISQAA